VPDARLKSHMRVPDTCVLQAPPSPAADVPALGTPASKGGRGSGRGRGRGKGGRGRRGGTASRDTTDTPEATADEEVRIPCSSILGPRWG
jgi:hypothetical protein